MTCIRSCSLECDGQPAGFGNLPQILLPSSWRKLLRYHWVDKHPQKGSKMSEWQLHLHTFGALSPFHRPSIPSQGRKHVRLSKIGNQPRSTMNWLVMSSSKKSRFLIYYKIGGTLFLGQHICSGCTCLNYAKIVTRGFQNTSCRYVCQYQ